VQNEIDGIHYVNDSKSKMTKEASIKKKSEESWKAKEIEYQYQIER